MAKSKKGAPKGASKWTASRRDKELFARAVALHRAGRLAEAEMLCRNFLRANPDHPEALHLLGLVYYQQRRYEDAVALLAEAVRLAPHTPAIRSNFGLALTAVGRAAEAVVQYREALALCPDDAVCHSNLGMALRALGQHDQAIASYQRALSLGLQGAEIYSNLGNALAETRRFSEAEEYLRRAIALNPNLPQVHNNLGNVLRDQGRFTAAEGSYRQALALQPDCQDAHLHLANLCCILGRLDEAIAGFHQGFALGQVHPAIHSNYLLALQYSPRVSHQDLFAAACGWGERHTSSLAEQHPPHPNIPDPARRLRVGYVSPDLRRHPVGFFVEPLLAHHNPEQVEVFCYYTNSAEDELTARLRCYVPHWRNLSGAGDAALAAQIREDRIDLLIDLSGHTAGHRLLLFTRKPAPVQLTWLGYPGTTGVPAIDYLLGDWHICPAGDECYYTEHLVRLPHCYLCWQPPQEAPGVAPPPLATRGYVTFGCFNNLSKVTDEVVALWARILRAVPHSRLFLKTAVLDDDVVRTHVIRRFCAEGVTADRLELAGNTARAEHLAAYAAVDIALDPFPFNGGTTTVEALWMGVPVVTLAGDRYAARVGTSILRTVGLAELVADSPEAYATVAISLAQEPERVAALRTSLRDRMLASPLCDAPRYARDVEAAYREMWQRWCHSQEK